MNFFIKSMLLIIFFSFFSCSSENKKITNETDKNTNNVLVAYNPKHEQIVQTFELNTSKQQIIKGEQGTILTFPRGCFGKVQGNVKIELIECYSIQDMILNGLSTQTTDGKLLETEGMIYLNALSEEGDTLKIGQGNLSIKMPTKQTKEGINIFDGVEKNGQISWALFEGKMLSDPVDDLVRNSKKNTVRIDVSTAEPPLRDSSFRKNKINSEQSVQIDRKIKNEYLVNYVFNISKMGWINCDRYIEGKTAPLIVTVPKESIGASYYLILKNYNSSVPPKTTSDGKLSFMVPVNEPYTIVGLSSKGEDIYFNMIDYTGGKSEVDYSGLKPVTRQELTDLLLKKFGKDIWNRPLA